MNAGKLLAAIREQKPLVYHITNAVTIGSCADITRACGGLPVMAQSPEEAEEMAAQAQALVLNIGTLTEVQVQAMLLAGKKANALGRPVILDPVGAGATGLRLAAAKKLLKELKIDIIKGNGAEIAVLAGGKAEMRGVESTGVSGNLPVLAAKLAKETKAVVVATGPVDLVTDGKKMLQIHNGHVLMSQVVGTGCMLASLLGCFAAVEPDRLQAAASAVVAFNVAAEMAVQQAAEPMAFKLKLIDRLFLLDEKTVAARQNMEKGEA